MNVTIILEWVFAALGVVLGAILLLVRYVMFWVFYLIPAIFCGIVVYINVLRSYLGIETGFDTLYDSRVLVVSGAYLLLVGFVFYKSIKLRGWVATFTRDVRKNWMVFWVIYLGWVCHTAFAVYLTFRNWR